MTRIIALEAHYTEGEYALCFTGDADVLPGVYLGDALSTMAATAVKDLMGPLSERGRRAAGHFRVEAGYEHGSEVQVEEMAIEIALEIPLQPALTWLLARVCWEMVRPRQAALEG